MSCSIFFIVGMGRSGTLFLSKLLNQAPNAHVIHETSGDRDMCIQAYWHPNKSMTITRMMQIQETINRTNCEVYGEVSSYLRYQPLFLKYAFEAQLFHLIRDGQNVVRSMMGRRPFTKQDEHHTGKITPKLGDPAYLRWSRMERFERVCWYWNDGVTNLMRYGVPTIKLEDIIEDYQFFLDNVLKPLQLNISEKMWKSSVKEKVNASQSYGFPSYKNWSNAQKMQFEEWCGQTMQSLGYMH